MSLPGQKIKVDGFNLNIVRGDGAAVLLLHGFPDSAWLWRKQIPPWTHRMDSTSCCWATWRDPAYG